jgi:cell division protein FtsB
MPAVSDKAGLAKKILRSKAFLVLAIIILAIMALYLGRVIHRKYEVAEEIKSIKERQESLVRENQRLGDLLEYLKTDTYKDRVARQDLGLQREGETVVVFSEGEDAVKPEAQLLVEPPVEEKLAYVPIYKKWWRYFFVSED